MWSYCTLTHDQLVKFAFDMYDLDNSGEIEREEVKELVMTVFGKADLDQNTERMLHQMDKDGDGSVSLKEFRKMEAKANTILRPCFLVQNCMIKKVGEGYWKRQKARRRKWCQDNNNGQDMDPMDLHRHLYDIPEKSEIIEKRNKRKNKRASSKRANADKKRISGQSQKRAGSDKRRGSSARGHKSGGSARH